MKPSRTSSCLLLINWLPLCLRALIGLGISISASCAWGQIYVFPAEAAFEMDKLKRADLFSKYKPRQIGNPAELGETALYLYYQHARLTYFIGPFESPAQGERAYAHWDGIRKELLQRDPERFGDSQVNLLQVEAAPPGEGPPVNGENDASKGANRPVNSAPQQSAPAPNQASAQAQPPNQGRPPGGGFGAQLSSADEFEAIQEATPPWLGRALPSRIDLSVNCPPPEDQRPQMSCLGFTLGYGLKTYQERVEERWSLSGLLGRSSRKNHFSPGFVYNPINGGKDLGAKYPDGLQRMLEHGVCKWTLMPFAPNAPFAEPSRSAVANGGFYLIDAYRRVDPSKTNELKAHLASGFPIPLAALVDERLMKLRKGQIWSGPPPSPGYGHAILIVGYDDSKSAFKVLNSWGKDWADDGYGWIDYSLFNTVAKETYVVKDAINEKRIRLAELGRNNPERTFETETTVMVDRAENGTIQGIWSLPPGQMGEIRVVAVALNGIGRSIPGSEVKFSSVRGELANATQPVQVGIEGGSATWRMTIPPGAETARSWRAILYVNDFAVAESL